MLHPNSFPKKEHLCLKSSFDALFETRKSIHYNGMKIVWIVNENLNPIPAQVAISVSKRHFKRAVHRNILKRRIREAYRLHKSSIISKLIEQNISISFLFIYTVKDIKEYREIEENVIHSLLKLEYEIAKWKQINSSNSLAITNDSDTSDKNISV